MKVNFLQLLQESHQVDEYIDKEVRRLGHNALLAKPDPKRWSAIEVIDHLNLSFDLYMPRLEKGFAEAIDRAEVREEVNIRTSRAWMIKSVAPKDRKRPFKMKTFAFFEPDFEPDEVSAILNKYAAYRLRFNEYLRACRTKNIDLVVVQSAIKQVSFRLPEALKFLLSHEQRHIIQLQETLDLVPEGV